MTAATADGTWTLPSHLALLHSSILGFDPPRDSATTLAGMLAQAGFVCVGSVGGGWLAQGLGFDAGFDVYADHWNAGSDLPAVLAGARAALVRYADAPTFLFVHSYNVHQVGPDARRFRKARGPWEPVRLDDAALAREKAAYATRVRSTDELLTPLLEQLRALSHARPVSLVVVSDHGEALGEHKNFGHGAILYDESVRVPMIAWGPGLIPGGRVSDRPTTLLDVAPSLLASVGIVVSDKRRGANLWPYWSGRASAPPQADGSLTHTPGAWAFRDARTKLIAHLEADGSERLEFYDLAADPGEMRDLAAAEPKLAAVVRSRLLTQLRELGIEPAASLALPRLGCWSGDRSRCAEEPERKPMLPPVDDETKKRLRALGYGD